VCTKFVRFFPNRTTLKTFLSNMSIYMRMWSRNRRGNRTLDLLITSQVPYCCTIRIYI